jgi:Mrp family chromosome partitioning ATPase
VHRPTRAIGRINVRVGAAEPGRYSAVTDSLHASASAFGQLGNVMVTLCWAAKGGSGTTVVAAALALRASRHSLLVDLDGELPAALGVPEPDRPGVFDWLCSDAAASQLADLVIDISPNTSLLPCGFAGRAATPFPTARVFDDERWQHLAAWIAEQSGRGLSRDVEVVIDAGTGSPHPALVGIADQTLLVTRPCYLSLRRAVGQAIRPSGVILVDEPGHALTARDVERAIGAPVVSTVSFDPAIARAVDAGLLASRLPRVIARELRRAAA